MNPTILFFFGGVIGPGFLHQVPTLDGEVGLLKRPIARCV